MTDLKIGVVGAGGRMGGAVVRQVTETDGCHVVAACDTTGNPAIGIDAGQVAGCGDLGVKVIENAAKVFDYADVVIEFSLPTATAEHADYAGKVGCAHIVGTTGLTTQDEIILKSAAERTTIVYAPNMSLAVNILFALTRQVASMLNEEFDIEILEMHHRHKVDAPSGTALGLGEAAAAGRGTTLKETGVLSRERIMDPRKSGAIGFATLRGGDVSGDHSVIFAAEGERLELHHKASSRQIFARGAVRGAFWAQDKPAGLYSMFDVLGLQIN